MPIYYKGGKFQNIYQLDQFLVDQNNYVQFMVSIETIVSCSNNYLLNNDTVTTVNETDSDNDSDNSDNDSSDSDKSIKKINLRLKRNLMIL